MTVQQGIFYDMPAATYFADPCDEPSLTQSFAKLLLERSPAHVFFRHPKLNHGAPVDDDEYSSAKAIGNAAHKLVLGRGKQVCIIEADNFRTKQAQETRDQAAADGYTPILAKHHKAARELAASIRGELDLIGCTTAFAQGSAEVVMIAKDDDIWLRSMADWIVSPGLLYDLKTGGQSASPLAIPSRMVESGWDVQAAMQERILDILYPESAGRRTFRFVAVENAEPFALTVNELSESVMTMGRKKLRAAIDIWRRCINRCEWPSYPPVIHRPDYPSWDEKSWLDREIADAARNEFCPEGINAG